jgi:predicted permease
MIRPGIRRFFSLALRRRDRIEREVDDELRAHLEHRVQQLIARGVSPDDAWEQARARFGVFDESTERLKQHAHARERRMRWSEWIDVVAGDVKYALRQLRKAPGFSIAVALTLAFGIGANAAMFGIVDRLLLRAPDHVRDPERVVEFVVSWDYKGMPLTQRSFPYFTYDVFRRELKSVEHIAVQTYPSPVPLGRGENAQQLNGAQVSASFFPLTGVRPELGRFFAPDEDLPPNGQDVAVLGYGAWQRVFGGDRGIIGKTIELGRRPFTVIGVAPRGFTGLELEAVDVWVPITAAGNLRWLREPNWMTVRNATWMRMVARLKPGYTAAQLAAESTPLNIAYGETRWSDGVDRPVMTAPSILESNRSTRGPVAKVAALLGGLSVIVLLIACANVANLLLSRSVRRRQELAIRLALGVSRGRLAAQLLVETLVLAVLGGVGACGVAWVGGSLARSMIFGDVVWADLPVDTRVLAYVAAATVASALVAGLAPALRGSRADLTVALKSGAREGRSATDRTRTTILLAQSALSVVLLVVTGLFVRSLDAVYNVHLGMEPERVVLGRMNLGQAQYTPEQSYALFLDIAARLRAMPEFESVSLASTIAGNNSFGYRVFVPGMDSLPQPRSGGPFFNAVDPYFFRTVGTRMLQGRTFTTADSRTAAPVAIINETMAKMIWPQGNAIGKCIRIGADTAPCATIVGVAERSRRQNWIEGETFQVMVPLDQMPNRGRLLLARPRGAVDARAIVRVRQVMQTAAPGLPYAEVQPLVRLYDRELRPWKLGATMLGAFAGLALFLVALGLFATLSFAVAQRTREIGVRIALGARGTQVVTMIMRQGLLLVAVGAAVGVSVSLWGGRFVQPLLFETSPRDVLVFAASFGVLSLVAAVAIGLPAFRASRIDPIAALRED